MQKTVPSRSPRRVYAVFLAALTTGFMALGWSSPAFGEPARSADIVHPASSSESGLPPGVQAQAYSDAGVLAYGDAQADGGPTDIELNSPVEAMAADPAGTGYWLVAADGGVFNYGGAPFFGSAGSIDLNAPIVGMASTPDGDGYWLAGSDGTVYAFGDARPYGDNASASPTEPIAAIAATPSGGGYWLLEPDAFPVSFDHPTGGDAAVVSVATSQVAGDPDQGMFCNPYRPCEPWCALFATWVWEQAGIPMPQYAFVGDAYDWAAANTAVLPPTATPSPGDFVFYGTGPQSVATAVHMGIVAQVWRDGEIITVEGDAGPGPDGHYNVVVNGPFLPSQSASYNGFPVFAFGVP